MIRPIVGYESRYGASDEGYIFSFITEKILKPSADTSGYASVSLSSHGGTTRTHRVHRLILETFLPRSDMRELEVNHIDGNKLNNNINNLEWVTREQNIKHSFEKLGRKIHTKGKLGDKHHLSMPVAGYSLVTGEKIVQFGSMREAEGSGFYSSKISDCVRGKQKSHKGLVWKENNKSD